MARVLLLGIADRLTAALHHSNLLSQVPVDAWPRPICPAASHEPMEDLIATYGYPAILAGTFLEGETVLLVGGYLASLGYLSLPWVAFCAFLGSWAGDSLYFFIGRRWGGRLLEMRPTWRPSVERALRLLQRYDVIFILCFRFVYGVRTVSPFVIGMSGVSPIRFVLLNMVAAALWAVAFSVTGYLLASVLASVIADFERYEIYILVVLVGLALIGWFVHGLCVRRRHDPAPPGG
jgi:membrane protein DedA with SNARE-associated domain